VPRSAPLRDEFGHTVDAIAARLGVSHATVYQWAKDPDWRDLKGTTAQPKPFQ